MLQPMAMKITKKNYFLVSAIFGSWFVHTTEEDGNALGNYAVINRFISDPFFKKETYPEYQNSWMSEEDFLAEFEFVNKELKDQFVEVRHH